MVRRRFLAAVGDANDPDTWSGIPYHFLQAGREQGLLDEGLPLSVDGWIWRLRRWSWNATSVLSGDRLGGYQYSVQFLEKLWAPHHQRLHGGLVFNCFQLFPPSVVADSSIEKWYFIDQTLLQLFDHYGVRSCVGRRIAREAVKREREGYLAATGVIVHSRWAAASVVQDHGVPAERVHVVLPGANLDPRAYGTWEREEVNRRANGLYLSDPDRPVRFIFVGKNWKRKGLDRLIKGFAIARRQGVKATLRVIGCRRESLPSSSKDIQGIEWMGFVDKRSKAEHFLRSVGECDVGCLVSRAEAGGIAIREYHALGLAVLGTTAGGSPDHALAEASWLIDPEAPDEVLAQAIINVTSNRSCLAAAKQKAWSLRYSLLYPATIRAILPLVARVAA